jgi:hypothetical protein
MNIDEIKQVFMDNGTELSKLPYIVSCNPKDVDEVTIIIDVLQYIKITELDPDSEIFKQRFDMCKQSYYENLNYKKSLKIQKLGYAEDIFGDIAIFHKFFGISQQTFYNSFSWAFGMVENHCTYKYYYCSVDYYGIVHDLTNDKYIIYVKSECNVPKFGYIGEIDRDDAKIQYSINCDDNIGVLYGGYHDAIKNLKANNPTIYDNERLFADIDEYGNCLYYDMIIEKYHAYTKLPHLL